MKTDTPKDLNTGFKLSSKGINKLLEKATPEGGNGSERRLDGVYYGYSTQIAKYSIQFQGCHHIQKWNKDAEDDADEVRVATKRLVRFRLVPYNKCAQYNPWFDSNGIQQAKSFLGQVDYGDYIVDMNTFVESYLEAKQEEEDAADDDAAAADDAQEEAIDINEYTQCAAFDFDDGADDDNGNDVEYYLGPFCADQGGEIRLQLFSDDTCTTTAKCNGGATRGANCYTQVTGIELPYTSESIIKDPCVPCSAKYSYLDANEAAGESVDSDFDFGYARDSCSNLYDVAGKCEKNMDGGKYNYGCSYIKGIQLGMSRDGYAIGVKRALGADAAMAGLGIACTFIGMYVYYLRYVINKMNAKRSKQDFYVPSTLS